MIATINGVTVQGTPEEILKYTQLANETFNGKTTTGIGWMREISNSGKAPAYLGEYICFNGQ